MPFSEEIGLAVVYGACPYRLPLYFDCITQTYNFKKAKKLFFLMCSDVAVI
jgi:hypothetical protein